MVQERTPPDSGFEPTERPSWRGSFIVVDPTPHADGQKIAMEKRSDIGDPAPILRSLARVMAVSDGTQPFSVQIHPIVQENSFWMFAEAHDFKISMIQFDVAVPNMFGGATEFENELRTLHTRNNVSRVRTTLVSDGRLNTNEPHLAEVVNYTEKGMGDLRAKSESGASYNSRTYARRDSLDARTEQPDFWTRLSTWLAGRF
jgi:hypothetical protein